MNIETTAIEPIDETDLDMAQQLQDALITKADGNGNIVVTKSVNNAVAMLTFHPDWQGVLAYDAFNGRAMLTAPIPGSREDNGRPFTGRPLKDVDYTDVRMWFDRHLAGMSKSDVLDAVDRAIHDNVADPLRQYLEEAMEAWDGKPRIDRLFDDYLVSEFESAYSKELGRISMMMLVQRGLYPGAFQKMVPILEGQQDIGKSSALRALCPDPAWFLDNLPHDLNSADASIALKGKFLVELAELASLRKSEIEDMKSFITRMTENYRPKYGKLNVQEPRRCMIWGTTNAQDYLRDATGNTRFYPIALVEVDIDAIARDRQQLLGEAAVKLKKAVEAGEKWWEFSKEAQTHLDKIREEKKEEHPWTGLVLAYIDGKDEVSPREVLTASRYEGGLGLPVGSLKRFHSNEIASILRNEAGWERDGVISAGKFKGNARFVPKGGIL